MGILREIRFHFEKIDLRNLFKALFNKEPFSKPWSDSEINLSIRTQITKEANLSGSGMTGNITGAHYTKIFADDFVTIKDRVSPAERRNTELFLRELTNISTIEGNIIFSGTPWHKEDGWKLCPEPIKYPAKSDIIKELTKDRLLEYKRQLGASLYAANYDLLHIADENRLFNDPVYGTWKGEMKMINAYIDPSYEGKASTAMAMIGMGQQIFVRGWVWHKHIVDCYNDIIKLAKQFACGTIYIETNADKGASRRDLAKKWQSVMGINERMNKHIKIISYLKQKWQDLTFADDCQPEFMNQVLDYTEDADLKDAPDALAALVREMRIGQGNFFSKKPTQSRKSISLVKNLPN